MSACKKTDFRIKGLDCSEEVNLLKKGFAGIEGIEELSFNILQAKMSVRFNPEKISEETIIGMVHSMGMRAVLWEGSHVEKITSFWRSRSFTTLLSALFLLLGFISQFKFFYLGAIFAGIFFVLPKAYISFSQFRPDMNLLMVAAILGAICIGEWFEGASVAFLFSLALLLEEWSTSRARKAVEALMQESPPLARMIDLETGSLVEKPVEDVVLGSTILIRPGEKVPLDGIVIEGQSLIDQSAITGESMPLLKEVGDEVYAGTFNAEGALKCRVTKPSSETFLARMIKLVEEARSKRSGSEQWVETFARYYTPIMFLFAVLIMFIPPLVLDGGWYQWIYRGLVVLVIACPCALVISTPVSIVSALTSAARQGILIKGGIYLEEMGQLKALALDKTGTLTYGHPEVQEVVPFYPHTEQELMERAVALEKLSEHPLARAIIRKGEEWGINAEPAANFQAILGKGALATFRGKLYWIGSHRFMHEMHQETEEVHSKALSLEDAGHSIVAIGTDDHVCGLISVADSPRKWIRETIEAIRSCGVERIVMLTGDNEPTARALAAHAGVDAFQAELLPEEKVEAVLALIKRWRKVGMVGDGINDAAAMASATVGIAMAKIGTDAAIEAADISLMSDDLSMLPWLMKHSKRTLGIIKQNIAFSLGVKGLFIALALFNVATLWMAIAADTGATLVVIFNALRLLKDSSFREGFRNFTHIFRNRVAG